MKILNGLIAICLSVSLMSCSRRVEGPKPTKISAVRAEVPGSKIQEIPISRKELLAAINRGMPANKIRMVPVFQGQGGASQPPPPQYRFFGINPESAYYLLGLRDNDVLVAAQDYVVWSQDKFGAYVSLLPRMKEGWLEILRSGDPLTLKFNLID